MASNKKLSCAIEHKMKKIFVGLLDLLDKEVDNGNIDEEVFKALRAKVLNTGNYQIRNMKKELDERYNVEFITYHTIIPVIPLQDGEKQLGALLPGSARLKEN